MDLTKDNSRYEKLNIEIFSNMIGEKYDISPSIFKNYILVNISIAMTRNTELKKNINKIYLLDKIKYYNAAINSTSIDHVIITQGTLEQEIDARKILGILLIAESDYNLRSNIITLLRKSYPMIFNAVKNKDKNSLTKRYLKMDNLTRKTEGRLDSSIYFYFSIYRFQERVDQGFIISIIKDMNFFEFNHPITRVIDKEVEIHKSELQKIKSDLKREYGNLNSYTDVLNSKFQDIRDMGVILENLFIINKFDINYLFFNSSFLNLYKF